MNDNMQNTTKTTRDEKEIVTRNLEKLLVSKKSEQVLLESLKMLFYKEKNIIRLLFFLGIEIIAAVVMVRRPNTIAMAKDLVQLLITIIIAMIAVVFTGYVFSQSLITDDLLKVLLSVERGSIVSTNQYFAKVMFSQLFCLMLDLLVFIGLMIKPIEYFGFISNSVKSYFAYGIITLLLYCNLENLIEMKSFVFNVFQLFNLNILSRGNKIIRDEPQREEECEGE